MSRGSEERRQTAQPHAPLGGSTRLRWRGRPAAALAIVLFGAGVWGASAQSGSARGSESTEGPARWETKPLSEPSPAVAGALSTSSSENAGKNLPQAKPAARDGERPAGGQPGEADAQRLLPGRESLPPAAEGGSLARRDLQANPREGATHFGGTLKTYRIGVGDLLQVNVWREPEVSAPSIVVRSDGKISLPLIKEVPVLGLTPAELEQSLTTAFTRFIHAPDVTVIVQEIRSEKVYVVGAVASPGSILLASPMRVLQVLAEAGGLTEFAKRNRIQVVRMQGDRQVRLPFRYEDVIKGKAGHQNVWVLPGDTIVVPQ